MKTYMHLLKAQAHFEAAIDSLPKWTPKAVAEEIEWQAESVKHFVETIDSIIWEWAIDNQYDCHNCDYAGFSNTEPGIECKMTAYDQCPTVQEILGVSDD